MSDLHLEMEGWRPDWRTLLSPRPHAVRHPSRGPALHRVGAVDLVILAGDIHNGLRGVVYADQVAQYLDAPVVMIAGNHEFYHHDIEILVPALRKAVSKTSGRVHFLQDEAASFECRGEAVQVLGCSLWTDYALHGDAPAAMAYAQKVMNDHKLIRRHDRLFTPVDAQEFHVASADWLGRQLAASVGEGRLAKTIVVTHHAPAEMALGRRQGMIAPAYASEIMARFTACAPALWIHGHTHFTHDSVVEGVHLVSAPRGYVGSGNAKYQPGLAEI